MKEIEAFWTASLEGVGVMTKNNCVKVMGMISMFLCVIILCRRAAIYEKEREDLVKNWLEKTVFV